MPQSFDQKFQKFQLILRLLFARQTESGQPQFSIEWYTSDTTVSIDYLRKGVVDVGITYHAVAEHTALEEKIVDRVEYVWRDHWMLVGVYQILHHLLSDTLTHRLYCGSTSHLRECDKIDLRTP